MKGILLSRVYFHTRTHTAELMGSERGWLRFIAANASQRWWGLDDTNPLDRALDIANMIVPNSSGQYVLDYATMIGHLVDGDRLSAIPPADNYTALVKDYAYQAIDDRRTYQDMLKRYGSDPIRNVRYDTSARNALVDILNTCLRVHEVPLRVGDHIVSSANVELNTALATGDDAVCLAAKIHGWCEIHPWIEEADRTWFADVIEYAVASGVYREGIWHTGTTGDTTERQRVRQGWNDVTTLLRDVAQHPGEVVLSYSVCDEFPNPEVSTSMPPWPAGVPHWWEELTPAQQKERSDARRLWYDLESDQRWETAMAGIRYSQPWANITPENLRTSTFGPPVTLFDVFHPDRVERVRMAFERDAQAEAEEEKHRVNQPA